MFLFVLATCPSFPDFIYYVCPFFTTKLMKHPTFPKLLIRTFLNEPNIKLQLGIPTKVSFFMPYHNH